MKMFKPGDVVVARRDLQIYVWKGHVDLDGKGLRVHKGEIGVYIKFVKYVEARAWLRVGDQEVTVAADGFDHFDYDEIINNEIPKPVV